MRFERGVDPEAAPTGADRACRLMAEWCGARVLRGVVEAGGPPPRRADRAAGAAGVDADRLPGDERGRRGGVRPAGDGTETVDEDTIRVEVPGYRVDLEREVDLIEEVVRVQGYDRVGSTLPPIARPGGLPAAYAFRTRVRDALRRAGLREVRQIPFVSEADLRMAGDDDAIRVTNPLQADDGWLRTRLTPGVLKVVRHNAHRHVRSVAVFEVDTVFRMRDGRPEERPKAAFALNGNADPGWARDDRPFDLFDAKGIVEAVMAELGIAWTLGDPVGRPVPPRPVGRDPGRRGADRRPRRDPPARRRSLRPHRAGRRGRARGRGPDAPRAAGRRVWRTCRASRRSAATSPSSSTRRSRPRRVRSALEDAAGEILGSVRPVRRVRGTAAARGDEEPRLLGRFPRPRPDADR